MKASRAGAVAGLYELARLAALGTAAMGVLLYMGIAMMPRQMKLNLFLMLGTMMARGGTVAYAGGGATFRGKTVTYATGAMIHAGMSVVFGLIHAGFITAFGLETSLAAWGVLFGFVHWIVVGMGLGMMRLMHPLIRSGDMEAPGAFVDQPAKLPYRKLRADVRLGPGGPPHRPTPP